jgi:lipoprotein-anchoring transpeptidase ErfK/SrfK
MEMMEEEPMGRRLLFIFLFCILTSVLIAGCNFLAIATEGGLQTSTLPETTVDLPAVQTTTAAALETSTTNTTGAFTTTSAAAATTASEATTDATTKATTRRTTKATTTTAKVDSPYYLYAEKGSFTLVAYGKDASGNYTQVVRVMRMAIGRGTMTPSGKFTLGQKYRWYNFSGIYAQYAVRYKSGLMIHSSLYNDPDNKTMVDSSYTGIGTKATSGCLRIATKDSYWVYNNCPSGTVLEIVEGSPRGFTAPPLPPIVISGQDPTDPGLAPAPTTSTLEPTATTASTAPENTSSDAMTAAESDPASSG